MKKIISIGVALMTITALMGVGVHFASATYSQCSDGFNNDPVQDNLVDAADPGCHVGGTLSGAYDPTINSEFNSTQGGTTALQCSDGMDNDGAQGADAADPDCHSDNNANNASSYNPNDNSEFSSCITNGCNPPVFACSDGIDNDGDGKIDFGSGPNNDPGCTAANDNDEFNASPVNNPPQCPAISAKTVTVGNSLQFSFSATDTDTLTYSAFFLPTGASFLNQIFNWTPNTSQAGVWNVILRATDTANQYCDSSVSITVNSQPATAQCSDNQDNDGDNKIDYPNDPGCFGPSDNDEFNTQTFQCSDNIDNDGDGKTDYPTDPGCFGTTDNDESNAQTFQCSDNIDNDGDGKIDYPNDPGCFGTTDNDESNQTQSVNRPPYWNSFPNQTVQANQTLQFFYVANDPDNDPLTYTTFNLPSGASYNNGSFSWTPMTNQIGTYTLTIQARDPQGLTANTSVNITVTSTSGCVGSGCNTQNQPPVCNYNQSYYTIATNTLLQFTVSAYDPNNDFLTWNSFNLPLGASFDSANYNYFNYNNSNQVRNFRWTPTLNQIGVYTTTFRAQDQFGSYCDIPATIQVTGGQQPVQNQPPYFTSTAATQAFVNQLYTYDANAADPENDSLTFALITAPSGMILNPSTGLVQWTPSTIQGGSTYPVTISVSDGRNTPVTQSFSVFVRGTTVVIETGPTQTLSITSVRIENGGPVAVAGASYQAVTTATQCGCPVVTQPVISNGCVYPTAGYQYPAYPTTQVTSGYPCNSGYTTVGANYIGMPGANVIVTFETNIPSRGQVKYGLSQQYEFTSPMDSQLSTVHSINLGPLEIGRTYYIRA